MTTLTPEYKAYVAEKIREDHPELKDATDDETLLQTIRETELPPDASDSDWEQVLNETYPAPKKEGKGIDAGAIATGAVAVGLGALAAAGHVKSKLKPFEHIEKPAEASMEAFKNVILRRTPQTKTELINEHIAKMGPEISEMAVPKPPPQPVQVRQIGEFMPTSRAEHFVDPAMSEAMKGLESDPQYLKLLEESGGGKRISHEEVLKEVVNGPPMTVEELAGWKPDTPAEAKDIVRANFLRTYLWDNYLKALFEGDKTTSDALYERIMQTEPGYNNMSAVPGRALEIQKLFRFSKEISETISELKAIGATDDMIRKSVDAKVEKMRKETQKEENPTWFDIWRERIETYATEAKLSSPMTHAVNTASNFLVFTQRVLEKAAESGLYAAQSQMGDAHAAITYAIPPAQAWKDAFRKIWSDVGSEFMGSNKVDPIKKLKIEMNPTSKNLLKVEEKVLQGKAAPKALRYLSPRRWMAAADNFWKALYIHSELWSHAYKAAYDMGLRGEELAQKVVHLAAEPPPSWLAEIEAVAKEYTFQKDPDFMLKSLQYLQNVPFVRLLIPFVQTPYNILRFYGKRSVFGILDKGFYKDLNAGGAKRTEALARLSVGLGFTGAAVVAMNMGQVTGAYPKDKKEADVWRLEKKRPWSIKVGKYWLQYNRLQPIGSYLSLVAAVNEAYRENNFDKAESKLGRILSHIIKGPLDLPFVQGTSAFFDFIEDPERSGDKLKQLVASGFIPNIVRDIRLQMDNISRRPTNTIQAIELAMPVLSKNVPERINILGQNETGVENPIARGTKMISESYEDDKTRLFNKLGWAPPRTTLKLKVRDKEPIELEGDMATEYLKRIGKAADYAITRTMSNPKFAKLSEDRQRDILSNRVEVARDQVRNNYEAMVGLWGPNKVEAAKKRKFKWEKEE